MVVQENKRTKGARLPDDKAPGEGRVAQWVVAVNEDLRWS
jgi:hypothetical protein